MTPRIGITLGDPGGIGPEIILKSLARSEAIPRAHYLVYAPRTVIRRQAELLSQPLQFPFYPDSEARGGSLFSLVEIPGREEATGMGKPSAENGRISFSAFEKAVRDAEDQKIEALVTAPIAKRSWQMAGIPWAGHTDYLHRLQPRAIMFFWSPGLKVALFTHHIPLRDVISHIKRTELSDFFITLHRNLTQVGFSPSSYLVCGLNPHAGEGGLLGREEEEEIIPALLTGRESGLPLEGPHPPDVIFRLARARNSAVVIALYHDQGLIPFKLEAFEKGVNVTLGLRFVRTSPDHGTAFDIAGKGTADPESMVQAIILADTFAKRGFAPRAASRKKQSR